MAEYDIQLPSGQVVSFEGDAPPTPSQVRQMIASDLPKYKLPTIKEIRDGYRSRGLQVDELVDSEHSRLENDFRAAKIGDEIYDPLSGQTVIKASETEYAAPEFEAAGGRKATVEDAATKAVVTGLIPTGVATKFAGVAAGALKTAPSAVRHIGGFGAAAVGGAGAGYAQRKLIGAISPEADAAITKAERDQPEASLIGNLASGLPYQKLAPAIGATGLRELSGRLVGAGAMGGIQAGQEVSNLREGESFFGDEQQGRIGAAILGGFSLNDPTKLGSKIMDSKILPKFITSKLGNVKSGEPLVNATKKIHSDEGVNPIPDFARFSPVEPTAPRLTVDPEGDKTRLIDAAFQEKELARELARIEVDRAHVAGEQEGAIPLPFSRVKPTLGRDLPRLASESGPTPNQRLIDENVGQLEIPPVPARDTRLAELMQAGEAMPPLGEQRSGPVPELDMQRQIARNNQIKNVVENLKKEGVEIDMQTAIKLADLADNPTKFNAARQQLIDSVRSVVPEVPGKGPIKELKDIPGKLGQDTYPDPNAEAYLGPDRGMTDAQKQQPTPTPKIVGENLEGFSPVEPKRPLEFSEPSQKSNEQQMAEQQAFNRKISVITEDLASKGVKLPRSEAVALARITDPVEYSILRQKFIDAANPGGGSPRKTLIKSFEELGVVAGPKPEAAGTTPSGEQVFKIGDNEYSKSGGEWVSAMGEKVTKPDVIAFLEANAPKVEPVDIGKRDETVSTGTGKATPAEKAIIADLAAQKKAIADQEATSRAEEEARVNEMRAQREAKKAAKTASKPSIPEIAPKIPEVVQNAPKAPETPETATPKFPLSPAGKNAPAPFIDKNGNYVKQEGGKWKVVPRDNGKPRPMGIIPPEDLSVSLTRKAVDWTNEKLLGMMASTDVQSMSKIQTKSANVGRIVKMMGDKLYSANTSKTTGKELVQNAIDAVKSAGGGGRISYGTEGDNFFISDTGNGMTPEIVINKFLPAGESGKAIGSGGGLGLAKIAILGGNKEWEVVTISKGSDGKNYKTTLKGSGESYFDYIDNPPSVDLVPDADIKLANGMTLRYELTDIVNTGTALRVKVPENTSYDARAFVENALKYQPDIKEGILYKSNNYGLTGDPKDMTASTALGMSEYESSNQKRPDFGVVHTDDSPSGSIDFIAPVGDAERRGTYFSIDVLNRGILQYRMNIGFQNPVSLPDNMAINIKPKVRAEDKKYPFTTNREAVIPEVEKLIKDYLNSLGARKLKQTNDRYDNAVQNSPKFSHDPSLVFLDVGQKVPDSLMSEIASNKDMAHVVSDIAKVQNSILKVLKGKYPQENWNRASFKGILTGGEAYGVHFGKPSGDTPSAIYHDPFLTYKDAVKDADAFLQGVSPETLPQVAYDFWRAKTAGIALHEALHQRISDEGEELARGLTFKAGDLLDSIVHLTKDENINYKSIHDTLTSFGDELAKQKSSETSRDFIISQGGYEGYAAKYNEPSPQGAGPTPKGDEQNVVQRTSVAPGSKEISSGSKSGVNKAGEAGVIYNPFHGDSSDRLSQIGSISYSVKADGTYDVDGWASGGKKSKAKYGSVKLPEGMLGEIVRDLAKSKLGSRILSAKNVTEAGLRDMFGDSVTDRIVKDANERIFDETYETGENISDSPDEIGSSGKRGDIVATGAIEGINSLDFRSKFGSESGVVNPAVAANLGAPAVGAAVGYQFGDTTEEKLKNAAIGAGIATGTMVAGRLTAGVIKKKGPDLWAGVKAAAVAAREERMAEAGKSSGSKSLDLISHGEPAKITSESTPHERVSGVYSPFFSNLKERYPWINEKFSDKVGAVADFVKNIGTIEGNIGAINPKIAGDTMKRWAAIAERAQTARDNTKDLGETLLDKSFTEAQRESIRLAINRGRPEELRATLGEHPLAERVMDNYNKARSELDALHSEAEAAGMDIPYRESYWPTRVIDYNGLRKSMGKAERSMLENMVAAAQKERGRSLTIDERSNVVNEFISRGKTGMGGPSFMRGRTIDSIQPEWAKFYELPEVEIDNYITRLVTEMQNKRFFGKSNDTDTGEFLGDSTSIGASINKEIEAGRLTSDKAGEIVGNLRALFNSHMNGDRALGAIASTFHKIQIYTNLGDISNAIPQWGDFFNAWLAADLGSAVKGYGRRKFFKDLSEINIREGNADIQGQSRKWKNADSVLAKALNLTPNIYRKAVDVFTGWTSKVNQVGLGNSLLESAAKAVNNPDSRAFKALDKRYGAMFPEEWPDIVKSLKSEDFQKRGKLDDNTTFFAMQELANQQPLGPEGKALGFNKSGPLGRLGFTLRTFPIKQLDLIRQNGYEKLKSPDAKTKLEGIQYLAMYAAIVAMGQQLVSGYARDKLLGRKSQTSDYALQGFLQTFLVPRYFLMRQKDIGLGSAMAETALPGLGFVNDVWRDGYLAAKALSGHKSGGVKSVRDLKDFYQQSRLLRYAPVVGRELNAWTGRGAATERRAHLDELAGKKRTSTLQDIGNMVVPKDSPTPMDRR